GGPGAGGGQRSLRRCGLAGLARAALGARFLRATEGTAVGPADGTADEGRGLFARRKGHDRLLYVQTSRQPVTAPLHVSTNVVVGEFNAILVGSVLCSTTPVSVVMPFNVIVCTLPAGGMMVQATGVEPPAGGGMVVAPAASVTKS